MFDDARAGDRALLCHVSDQEYRHLLSLRKLHDARHAFPELCDRARRRGQIRSRHRLDGIDNERPRRGSPCLLEDVVERGIREQLQVGIVEPQAVRSLCNLPQRLLAGCVTGVEHAGKMRGNLLQERRLADAWIATEQHDRTGNQTTPQHAIEFFKARRMAQTRIFAQRAQCGGLGTLPPLPATARDTGLGERVPCAAVRALPLPFHTVRATLGAHVGFLRSRQTTLPGWTQSVVIGRKIPDMVGTQRPHPARKTRS